MSWGASVVLLAEHVHKGGRKTPTITIIIIEQYGQIIAFSFN